MTSLRTLTIELAPKILQRTSLLCSTSWISGTAYPRRVTTTFLVLKHGPKGFTDGTRVMFLAVASLTNADVTALKIDVSNTV
uniref:Uncharacterized protein n=1 Tax=Brassica oleracea TaxID=3712 RepID=A0A3P6GI41_BRAOL|nr:unnamed protein product [Brassica oleracea]